MLASLKLKHWMILLTAVAGVARIALCLQGGQFFLGDEARFLRGTQLYVAVLEGRWSEACWLLSQPDHQAFTWLAALLAPLQQALAACGHEGDWTVAANLVSSARWGAVLLSVVSLAILPVLFFLARAAGATTTAAGWATLFAAGSNTLFYMTRHLLPYDASLLLWLLALWASCGGGWRRWTAAGIFAALGFYLYNGYWFLVPLAALWHARRQSAWPARGCWLAGAAGTALVLGLVGYLTGGIYYWRFLVFFSGTVKQGLYAEGWSLPWEYLWHAESLGWMAPAVAAAAFFLLRPRRAPGYAKAALVGVLMCYAALVLGSVVGHRFVVYGRSVRPLVPLLALVAGGGLALALGERVVLQRCAVVIFCLLAAATQARHFGRIYPSEVQARVTAQWGYPKSCATYSGIMFHRSVHPVTRPDLALVNILGLYPLREYVGGPSGRVIQRWPNPIDYLPYQYEGYTPRERALLRAHDNGIRLVALRDPATVPDAPPPAQFMADDELPDGYDHGRH